MIQYAKADWALPDLERVGEIAGSARTHEMAAQANKYQPVHRSHDRYGRRIDVIDFHPSYHQIMDIGIRNRVPTYAWINAGQ